RRGGAAGPGLKRVAKPLQRIAVAGAGAWGTALANLCCRTGRDVRLWGRDGDLIARVNAEHENPRYLPGIALDPALAATARLKDMSGAELCLLAVPAQALRSVATALAPVLAPGVPLVLCAKGIEAQSGLLMNEVAAETLPGRPLAVLSGP